MDQPAKLDSEYSLIQWMIVVTSQARMCVCAFWFVGRERTSNETGRVPPHAPKGAKRCPEERTQ